MFGGSGPQKTMKCLERPLSPFGALQSAEGPDKVLTRNGSCNAFLHLTEPYD